MENVRTNKAYDAEMSLGKVEDKPAKKKEKQERTQEDRLSQIEAWWAEEQQVQAENRWQMARAQDFVDGEQWTEEEKAELEARNQPALVYNLIGTTVRWITGTEKRTRVDFSVLGRGEEDTESAEDKTALLKYLNDVNKGGSHRSMAFEDAVSAGVGWLEVGVTGDLGEEPLFEKYVDWRNVWPDRLSILPDYSDGRFIFKQKWVELEDAVVYFPGHEEALTMAAEDHQHYIADDEFAENSQQYQMSYALGASADVAGKGRQRVKIVECWYREARQCQVVKSNCAANKVIYNDQDPRLVAASQAPDAELFPAIRKEMRLMLFLSGNENGTGTCLYDGKSPYWHNRFPLVPIWGYRRKRNKLPYGVVKGLIDPQVDLNKRHSKAQYILSTKQVIMDEGAVDDMQEFEDEVARPDSIIVKKRGHDLSINSDRNLAAQHINIMNLDAEYIQRASGVTDENLGRKTNATSGKAIEARQEQGGVVTTDLFDNYRIAFQTIGELKLSLIEQYYDEEKVIRLVGERGQAEFKRLNSGSHNITDRQADFIVDQQAFDKTYRRYMAEQMFELIIKLPPEVALKMLDIVIEMTDAPMREVLVARIRKITGMRDDDAEPTPEEEEALAAQQKEQQRQRELNDRMLVAKVGQEEAKAAEMGGKAQAVTLEAVMAKLENLEKAVSVAERLQINPGVGPAADMVMEDASIQG